MNLGLKTVYVTGLVTILAGLTAIASNPTEHQEATIEKVLTGNAQIENTEVTFGFDEQEEKKEVLVNYSFLDDTFKTVETEEKTTAVLGTQKVADPSQRYRSVDEYLYVKDGTSIYKEDKKDSEVVKDVVYGDYVHKVGNDPYNDDGFSKVEVNGEPAYIETQLLTSDVLFKETSHPVYATTDAAIYDGIDCANQISTVEYTHSISTTGESKDFVRVKVDDKDGYIKKDQVSTEMVFKDDDTTMWTLCALNIRALPTKESDLVETIPEYITVKRIGVSEIWSKVQLDDGNVGYTKSENLSLERPISLGEQIAQFAQQFVGNPYKAGGTSLTNGADCSGFIMSVYANFGISVARTTNPYAQCGYFVSYANARPGDIIFYPGHVAMYIGNGQIVHASNSQPYPRGGIKIASATCMSIQCVKRIVD